LQGFPAFTDDGDPTQQSLAFQYHLLRLEEIGAVLVAAAGNFGLDFVLDLDDIVPASLGSQYKALVVVGSADFDNRVSDYSSRSRRSGIVSLYGFGDYSWCAADTEDNDYVSLRGTSMAAAQVAGLAAEKLRSIPEGTAVADIPGLVKLALQKDGLNFRDTVKTAIDEQQIAPLASTAVGIHCDEANDPPNPDFPLAPTEQGLIRTIPPLAPISFGDQTTLDLVVVVEFVCYLRIRV
jgi:hypothetical protein